MGLADLAAPAGLAAPIGLTAPAGLAIILTRLLQPYLFCAFYVMLLPQRNPVSCIFTAEGVIRVFFFIIFFVIFFVVFFV